MTDNTDDQVTIEPSENMYKAILYAFDEAKSKLGGPDGLIPFTVVLSGENLSIEEHEGDSYSECRDSAMRAVTADPAACDGYAFVYDGAFETDDDAVDAIILEYAEPDDDKAMVLGRLYSENDDGTFDVDEDIVVAGRTESFIPFDYRLADDADESDDESDEDDASDDSEEDDEPDDETDETDDESDGDE